MKRPNFRITSTVGHDTIKHSWNSSIRAIEALVKDLARDTETTYTLIASESVKEAYGHVSGSRGWQSARNGGVVVFSIQKIED